MLKLDYDAVHRFAKSYPNATWNGWVLELFKPTPAGYASKRGAFRNGAWGMLTRVTPDAQGRWKFRI